MDTLLYVRKGLDEKAEGNLEIKKFSPTLSKLFLPSEKKTLKNVAARAYFYLMAGKKYTIYYVTDDNGTIMHTSTVMPSCFKFRYLGENDCEIGPCYTGKDFRGRGIYPAVLKYILSDYKAENYYMTVHKNNASSIRGIEKAGFSHFGYIKKSRLLKIYRLAQEEK